MPKEGEFDMGLFNDLDNLEINMDYNPEEEEEVIDEVDENIEETEETEDNLDENESSEEVVEDEDLEKEGESTDEDSSPNIYSSFASVLNEQGLLPSLNLEGDTKIETVDDLATAFKSEIDTQVKDYLLNKIGESGYDALEKGISLAEYQQYQDNVQTLDGITEDTLSADIELSKKIIYQDYLAQGIDEARATRLLNKSINAGEDAIVEDAVESLSSLKLSEAKRLESLAEERAEAAKLASAQQEKIDNDLKNSIYNNSEIIKGIKVNKTIQDKVYNSITKIVGKSPDGIMENQLMRDRREDPTAFDSKLYYLYEITKGFSDFSTIVRKSESKAASKLERDLRKTKFEDAGTPSYLTDPDSYGGIGSEIVL